MNRSGGFGYIDLILPKYLALTLRYFFGVREKAEAKADTSGVQQVNITVKGGYSPDTVVIRQGVPVRFLFDRQETSSCSEQVVFGDFGIARDLPAFKTTRLCCINQRCLRSCLW